MNDKNDKDYDDIENNKNYTYEKNDSNNKNRNNINKMKNFSHKANFVLLSSLTHLVLSFNVSSSLK